MVGMTGAASCSATVVWQPLSMPSIVSMAASKSMREQLQGIYIFSSSKVHNGMAVRLIHSMQEKVLTTKDAMAQPDCMGRSH